MPPPENRPSLSRAALRALLGELHRQVADLTARNAACQAEIAQLRRSAQRQATPFSQGTRVANPQRPGRKPGAGPFHDREAPLPAQITAPPVDGPVTLAVCPTCGGPLAEERVDGASPTDIPAIPRPPVIQYRVAVCRCPVGGQLGRGQQPAVAPDQHGATAHRGGERARAAAPGLHDGSGVPVRTGPLGLEALQGIPWTQGASTPEALRRAPGASGTGEACLRRAVPESPVSPTDAPRWRVGGEPASLMAWETDAGTGSQSRSPHRHEEVQEVIPPDSAGVRGTDRGRSDDAQACDAGAQQKCWAPMLRASRDVLQTQKGRARDVGERLKGLWQEALQRWRAGQAGPGTDGTTEAAPLWDASPHPLRPRPLTAPDQQRLRNGSGWQHDRGHLRRCVVAPQVEPTNHRAERVLRPAVIARQVAQGAKNQAGAPAFAACKRVAQPLAKQGVGSMGEGLYRLCRSLRLPAASP